MGEGALEFVLATLNGVLTSFLLLYLLRFVLAPKISIESALIQGENRLGKPTFRFKIVNCRRRQCIDIQVQAHRVSEKSYGGHNYAFSRKIPLVTEQIFVLESNDISQKRTDFYSVISTLSTAEHLNIHKLFDDKDTPKIRVRVIATDPISNIRKVFIRVFAKSDVRTGYFDKEFRETADTDLLNKIRAS